MTWVPQYVFCHWVGAQILGTPDQSLAFEMSWEWIEHGLLPVWKPLLLGCLVVGTVVAAIGYFGLSLIWHYTLVMKYHERKRVGSEKKSAIVKK